MKTENPIVTDTFEATYSEPLEENGKITPFAIFAIFIAVCLNIQDGFDILAISFAANDLANDWGLTRGDLGIVFSASLFGMVVGALMLGPFADRFGRRTSVALGLFLSGIGMILATVARDVNMLVIARAITGFGIAGVLVSMNTLIAEYAGPRYRSLAIALFQLGYPLGGFLAGFAAAALLQWEGWRAVFGFGAILSFVFIPLILILPESLSFLARSKRSDALARLNHARGRLGFSQLDALPQLSEEQKQGGSNMLRLFGQKYIARTVLIWIAFFCFLITLYFLLSWIPKLMVDSGWAEADGNRAGRNINFAGMFGILLIGILGLKFRTRSLTVVYLLALAFCIFIIGQVGLTSPSIFMIIIATGFCLHGSVIGLYTTAAILYPPALRASGTGWALGLSRFGAVVGPMLAASMLEADWAYAHIFYVFAVPVLVAALAMFMLARLKL